MTKKQRAKWLTDPDYFKKQGAKGGKIGGKIAAANSTPAERSARATIASKAAALARTTKKKTATKEKKNAG